MGQGLELRYGLREWCNGLADRNEADTWDGERCACVPGLHASREPVTPIQHLVRQQTHLLPFVYETAYPLSDKLCGSSSYHVATAYW